ncbi:XRE family transcriptional regulator [Desertihabitans brevis]|uniref:XRE family transcriptional regulator n=1 Tax=Desertihabitans brevis TaxID=2268447 RepID=A0A367YS77_9ACTN|nr:helix-turn-helix transcriptional regulator [Desertihabitans brevis]RCK68733.1 XRE family transcriptional regulator [Desertihabitans brevis]
MGDVVPLGRGRAEPPGRRGRDDVEPLWRDLVGRRLRRERQRQGRTLAETAERAGISTQYLSEVERGRKEPSSEILSAAAGAVGLTLLDLTTAVAHDLRVSRTSLRGPVALAA